MGYKRDCLPIFILPFNIANTKRAISIDGGILHLGVRRLVFVDLLVYDVRYGPIDMYSTSDDSTLHSRVEYILILVFFIVGPITLCELHILRRDLHIKYQ